MAFTNVSLAQLRTMVRARLQNSAFWPDLEVNDYINEGIRIYQLGTGHWRARFIITTELGRVVYDLTTNPGTVVSGVPQVLVPLRATFNGQPLDFMSLPDMDSMGLPGGWQLQTTASAGVPPTPQFWGPFGGLNLMFIWPADASGQNSVGLDAITRAPVLTADSQFINIDSSELSPIISYVAHVASFKRGGQALAASRPLLGEFLKALALKNSRLRASSIFKQYMGAVVQTRRRPRQVEDYSLKPVAPGVH